MPRLAPLAALLLAAAASAQVAQRPAVVAGDEWRHVVYYERRSTEPNRVWRIDRVSSEALEGTENGEPLRLTPDLNVLETPLRKDTNGQALRFPLRVGDRWDYETDTLFKDNKSTAHVKMSVTVVAYERVTVVAGEYEAFKLHGVGQFRGLSRGGPGVLEGEFTSTYWYAPTARTIVKSIVTNPYRGTTTVELVAANLKP